MSDTLSNSCPAPVALFAYMRPDHLAVTVSSLASNPIAYQTHLTVFCDAAKKPEHQSGVNAVRRFVATIQGFASVTVVEREHNFGLAASIIDGVTRIVTEFGRVIVLEDDLIVSPHFLTYMNHGLDRFANDERVVSVHGYVYPVKQALPEAFFLRGADCWGWATWRRGWALFNPDGQALLDELKRRNLIKAFDFNGTYGYSHMLKSQIKGTNDSWAIRWYASAFLADKLTLYPGRSLVHNIGNDGSGTHCGINSTNDVVLSNSLINLTGIEVKHSELGFSAFELFFRHSKTDLISKVIQSIKYAMFKVFA
jgi:hypothetical protein